MPFLLNLTPFILSYLFINWKNLVLMASRHFLFSKFGAFHTNAIGYDFAIKI